MQAAVLPPVTPRNRRGRPRKINVSRDQAGKSRGEVLDLSVIFNQPHRKGAKDPKSELLGYPLGRLRLANQISEIQHRTGNEWALLVRSYAGVIGIPFGSPRSGSALGGVAAPAYSFSGDDGHSDPEEHERRVGALRSRYDGCFERLALLGRSLGRGNVILITMRRVCVEERYPTDHELGDLRVGLNALALELKVE